jgi:hypothetical protein
MRKIHIQIKKTFQTSFFLYLVSVSSICSAASFQDNLFQEMVSLTLSQITKTQVRFQSFDATFSPKIRFKLGEVEFKKRDKILLSAKTLWLEPSPMFLLSWRKTPSSKAFMNFNLEEGKTGKIDIRKAQGTLRANAETLTLESTRILPQKGEILISGDYQKSLKAFDGTITAKQFELKSIKGVGISGLVDLNATIQGYVSQERKIIPINGNGKMLILNGKIENPSVTKLLAKTLRLNYQDDDLYSAWGFKTIYWNFDINKGVMHANALNFQGSPLSVEGVGKVNFMTQSFHLKFKAKEKHNKSFKNSFNLKGTFKKTQIYLEVNLNP